MICGKSLLVPSLFVLVSLLAGCGGGGDSSTYTLKTALQDLDIDPDGLTTVLTFEGNVEGLAPHHIQSDGGQTAVSVVAMGTDLTVLWAERVTPQDSVRVLKGSAPTDYVPVATSDATAPTFVVAGATQGAGLGDDVVVVQFSGPRVVAEQVIDGATWSLVVVGQTLPLAESVFDFDVDLQRLTITTDESANVHAIFSVRAAGLASVAATAVSNAPVVGAATGDTQAPLLVSAIQRLGEDEFGRVIEFTFNEAMSPVFATQGTQYTPGFPAFAQTVEQVTPETLRVTFGQPVVPGLSAVAMLSVRDAHGNIYSGGLSAITAGSTEVNGYAVDPTIETLSGVGNDRLIVVTDQALVPSRAELAASWSLEVDGNAVDLAGANLSYDLFEKTLTVVLDSDHLNGLDFELTPAAVLDVDGQAFAAAFTGTIAGETVAPGIFAATQNRQVDPTGATLDIRFNEAVAEDQAEDVGNYTASHAATLLGAALQIDGVTVRLIFDAAIVPGIHTVAVAGVGDLAGNTIAAVGAQNLDSTDVDDPTAAQVAMRGFSGPDNDRVEVVFDDLMVAADVEATANWILESPVGTPLDPSFASIDYSDVSNTAVLTFDGGDGIALQYGSSFSASFGAMRDIAGNTIVAQPYLGTADVEALRPTIESVFVRSNPNQNQVWVRFDEALANFDDAFAQYQLRDANGLLLGTPSATPVLSNDGRGVRITFGQVVVAGVNEVDVMGLTDLAGNPMFPALARAVEAEDTAALDFEPAFTTATTVPGENNDIIVVRFDRRPSGFGVDDSSHFTLLDGGTPVSLAGAAFAWDGNLELSIDLGATMSLATNAPYTLEFDGLVTAQGIAMVGAASLVVGADGDLAEPNLASGNARVYAASPTFGVVVDFDEAVDSLHAQDIFNYALEIFTPLSAEVVGPRSVRLLFPFPVNVSDFFEVIVRDLAGNQQYQASLLTAADVAGPLVTGVDGVIAPGFGGDRVRVRFHKPVLPSSATDLSNYAVLSNALPLSLVGGHATYASADNEVTLWLPVGSELAAGQTMQVQIGAVADHSGFTLSPTASVFGPVTGDTTAPSIQNAFAERRASATGLVVDVLFSEDVDPTLAQDVANWSVSGGQAVLTADALAGNVVRLSLATPLGASDVVTATDMADAAGNTAISLDFNPVD